MPDGSFVTTGHTSGSAGVTACAVPGRVARLPVPAAVNAPPRNVRRFIMLELLQTKICQNLTSGRTPRHVRFGSGRPRPCISASTSKADKEQTVSVCPQSANRHSTHCSKRLFDNLRRRVAVIHAALAPASSAYRCNHNFRGQLGPLLMIGPLLHFLG